MRVLGRPTVDDVEDRLDTHGHLWHEAGGDLRRTNFVSGRAIFGELKEKGWAGETTDIVREEQARCFKE